MYIRYIIILLLLFYVMDKNLKYNYSRTQRKYYTNNLDTKEICNNHVLEKTYDNLLIKKVLIANIDKEVTHKTLKSVFSKYGKIVDCILKTKSGNKKSYAFITYENACDAQCAISAGYRKEIDLNHHWVRVIPAVSWNQPDSTENKACRSNLNIVKDEDKSIYNIFVMDENKVTIHVLNNDCLMHIFMYLPIADRVKIERVCKRWKAICEESWHYNKKLDLKPINWGLSKELKAPHVHKVLYKYGIYITNVDLTSYGNEIGNATLISIAKLCPNIQTINIKGLKHSSSGIKALADNCINIEKLVMSISDKENFSIQSKYPNFPTANDTYIKELSRLFSKNHKLQYLDLNCYHKDVKECLLRLPCKSVKGLRLYNIKNLGVVCTVVKKLQLQELTISNIYDVHTSISIVDALMPSAKNLKILQMPRSSTAALATDALRLDLTCITEFNHLTTLNLENHINVDDNFLIQLSDNCKLLLRINISYCQHVTDRGLKGLTTLPKLKVLYVNGLKNISDEALTHIPELQTLSCTSCDNIYYVGLITLIATSEKLENLYICNCKLITNDFVNAALEATAYRKHTILTVFMHGTNITKFTESSFFKINRENKMIKIF